MNIALVTAGTHGDVRPFVALARGLQRAGHTVTLAAPSDAASFVTGQDVPYASLGVDFKALAGTDRMRGAVAGRLSDIVGAYRQMQEQMRTLLEAASEVTRAADAVVYHPKTLVGAHVAEARNIPVFLALPAPVLVPTRAFPAPLGALPDLGSLNRATYAAARAAALPFHRVLNEWRAEALDLPPQGCFTNPFAVQGRPLPVLYAFSEAVVPRPRDWPGRVHVTGFWVLDGAGDDYEPTAELDRFLREGEPPIYVGFGSLSGRDPEETTATVLAAVQKTGVRAILATGWGGLSASDVSDSVYVLDRAPHEWLFPRCAAVVHHGGSGTTAAGLRAGRPTVVCPFFGDQPFWGRRVEALGAGPEPIPQKKLSVNRLAAAIGEAVADPDIRRRAAELGAVLQREDGVGAAAAVIEEFLDLGRSHSGT